MALGWIWLGPGEGKDPGDPFRIAAIVRHVGRSKLSCAGGEQDIQHEAARHLAKDEAFCPHQVGEGAAQDIPSCRSRSRDSPAALERGEEILAEALLVARGQGTGQQLGHYHAAEVEERGVLGGKLGQGGCSLWVPSCLQIAVGVEEVLGHAQVMRPG